jgi:GH15 family glucan-1,4-alpha-glucosidase
MEHTLANYALIGNSRSAALVCKNGSIDWCCLPEFHSSSIFASLLDKEKGGNFSLAPAVGYHSTQKYIPDTNVVETNFTTRDGDVRLIDAFTAMTEKEKENCLFPDHEILRIVEGVSGTVKMKLEYAPKLYYGKGFPQLHDHKKLGIHFSWKENIYTLLTTIEPKQITIQNNQSRAVTEFDIAAGQRVFFSLSYSNQSPSVVPEIQTTGWKRMQGTIRFWKDWIGRCKYSGLYQEHVKRSALALKLLTYAPSGAIIAAPTTSLPENLGGERNWDYRYCWLRDASFTTRVLMKLGFEEEVHAYMNWILHATQLTRPKLQVVYSVYGHTHLKEETLDWLTGYRNSKPVRIGNLAHGQLQLDVYGEVLDAAYSYSQLIKEFDHASRKFLVGLGKIICKAWDQPDNGIWEIRSTLIHHTHSKVMAWIGLDRLIKLCEHYQWKETPLAKFKETAVHIRDAVERFGYNERLKSYTREFEGTDLDASLMVLPLVGYCSPTSSRMVSTIGILEEHLTKNNMVYRYQLVDDGLHGGEGSFGVCNFWYAENLAQSGRLEKAIEVFETMVQHASPTGLLSEEIDTESYELLGNYPQGFSHIGLINAALSINEVYQKQMSNV